MSPTGGSPAVPGMSPAGAKDGVLLREGFYSIQRDRISAFGHYCCAGGEMCPTSCLRLRGDTRRWLLL